MQGISEGCNLPLRGTVIATGLSTLSLAGLQSSNIDPQWKKLLDTVGVTDEQLEDTNTANFIYDFVEKHGGIQEANRQLEAASKKGPPPPPSRHGPPPPSRGPPIGRRGLPPPPPRESSHSGSRGGNVPAPPPPPPVGKECITFSITLTSQPMTASSTIDWFNSRVLYASDGRCLFNFLRH